MTDRALVQSVDPEEIAAGIPNAPGEVRGSRRQIAEVVAFIARAFRPERIVLFGSWAYGTPRAGSDVDVMVIMETPLTPSQQAWAIRDAIGHRSSCQVDVHVRTPEQISVGLAEGDFFIEDVMLQGVTLYTREGMSRLEAPNNGGGRRPRRGKGLKQATRDWLRRADEDARAARVLSELDDPLHNLVCYHAQQGAEKYLKAVLQENDIGFPRTHQLLDLAERSSPVLPDLAEYEADLGDLTTCVDARYPDMEVDPARAVRTMSAVRSLARTALGLPLDAER